MNMVWSIVLIINTAFGQSVESNGFLVENLTADPVKYIGDALQEYPIVCLAEGGHQADNPHQLLRQVLSDKSILKTTDIIIIEFANARYQDVLDAYIRGEEVPFSELSKVWRNTGQSPHAPWDSPLYYELLKTIRAGNLGLPQGEKVRVIAGDPPIEWETIQTWEDYNSSRIPRDPYAAELCIEQAFNLKKKVLLIFGGGHLPKIPVGETDDLRNSLTSLILKEHPSSVKAIGFLVPEYMGIEDSINVLEVNTIYDTDRHWVGDINAELMFPEIYSLVTDENTGEQSWQQVPLYSGSHIRDLFDALIYIGPSSEWEYISGSFDEDRDKEYLKELERRSQVRFGCSWNSEEE